MLVRFVVMHALVGFGLAFAVVGALLWFDVSGLGTLMSGNADGPLAAAVLTFFRSPSRSGSRPVMIMTARAAGASAFRRSSCRRGGRLPM
jgi:hypothetical protein